MKFYSAVLLGMSLFIWTSCTQESPTQDDVNADNASSLQNGEPGQPEPLNSDGGTSTTTENYNQESTKGSNFSLDGKMYNASGMSVFLDRMSFTGQQNIAQAIVANDGTFKMVSDVPTPGMYMLRINQQRTWPMYLGNGKVKFVGDVEDPVNYTVKSSFSENEGITQLIANIGKRNLRQQQINQEFNQLRMSGGSPEQLQALQVEFAGIQGVIQQDIKDFAEKTTNPLLKVFACSLIDMEQNAPYIEQVLAQVKQSKPEGSDDYISGFEQRFKEATKLAIGRKAPDFELSSHKGETFKLSSMKSKVTLIDFWASWCRPCRAENPNLVRTYEKYKSKGFDVYSVSLDKDMNRWVQAIGQDKLTWKWHGSQLKGWSCSVAGQYNVRSIPATFLIDAEGNIIAKNLRGAALEQKLEEVFGS